eukprot:TRINITY_DN55016_c0_g1_i1.p1 TRINITY_DN55016_c0_g1~~TRINITY_DN55016_c0_g1_i1.p1  ORF type:complete len:326 (-),score=102.45 TRINITY_DN55016_c0_g1_i1:177-1154(-)
MLSLICQCIVTFGNVLVSTYRVFFFFFQAEDGIRDAQESRGLGDVYKRQGINAEYGGVRSEMSFVTVSIEGSHAVLSLNKDPVNSMDTTLWAQIYAAFTQLEQDPRVRGVVFTSGLKKDVFTAGLDLKELHAPSTTHPRLMNFWRTLSKTLIAIYSSGMVTIAAIPGACPAGGCCLALCCDYRIITAKGGMGLNEAQLGIPVPRHWIRLMASIVGARKADYILQTGVIVPSPEAEQMGMVDKLVATRTELVPAAEAEMKKWLRLPDVGRQATKRELRAELADAWTQGTDDEAAGVWDCLRREDTAALLGKVMASLGGTKKPQAKL